MLAVEGENVRLTCVSTGVPTPLVGWSRKDGEAFPDGVWRSEDKLL